MHIARRAARVFKKEVAYYKIEGGEGFNVRKFLKELSLISEIKDCGNKKKNFQQLKKKSQHGFSLHNFSCEWLLSETWRVMVVAWLSLVIMMNG